MQESEDEEGTSEPLVKVDVLGGNQKDASVSGGRCGPCSNSKISPTTLSQHHQKTWISERTCRCAYSFLDRNKASSAKPSGKGPITLSDWRILPKRHKLSRSPNLLSLIPHVSSKTIMPKAVKGVLLLCDPPQMAMILKLNKESNNGYIIEEIDDRTCLVKEARVDELKRNVKMLMDHAMGADDNDEEQEHDSDLD